MQLHDRGLFKLDDDVGNFLKFPVRNPRYPAQPITFRHLLTHTSSLDEGEALYSTYAVGDPTMTLEEAVTTYFSANGWSRISPQLDEPKPGSLLQACPRSKECYSECRGTPCWATPG